MTPHGDSVTPIRVLIFNESGIIREGLCGLLEGFIGIEVVASIGHLDGLGEIARQVRIDVVLIDANFPGEACFQATRRLRESGATTGVVIVSVTNRIGDVKRALESGANGFLLQEAGTAELEMALHAAATGKTFLCPTIIRQLAEGASLENGSPQRPMDLGMVPGDPRFEDMVDEAVRRGILREEG